MAPGPLVGQCQPGGAGAPLCWARLRSPQEQVCAHGCVCERADQCVRVHVWGTVYRGSPGGQQTLL